MNCATCGEEALRKCSDCMAYYCEDHKCQHLIDIDNSLEGTGIWSTDDIVSKMTDEQLVAARLRLAAQLYAVDRELQTRKFDNYVRVKPKANLTSADLVEERSVRRFGGKVTRPKPVTKKQKAHVNAIADVLASLTPEERQRITDAYNKRKQQ